MFIKKLLLFGLTTLLYSEGYINSIDMHFVKIKEGNFTMGTSFRLCPKDDPFSEKNEYQECIDNIPENQTPATEQSVKSFYMATTEVTQLQYYKVMGENPAYFKKEKLGHDSRHNPIENISWNDAKKFIEKLNKMENTDAYYLPSEIEWEYAARAGSNEKWCFGNQKKNLKHYAWYYGNAVDTNMLLATLFLGILKLDDKNNMENEILNLSKTHLVAKKKPNRWGLYDMYGNVWEWTSSCYRETYNKPCQIIDKKELKSLRGGSIVNDADGVTSASRVGASPSDCYAEIGFRVASRLLSVEELKKIKEEMSVVLSKSTPYQIHGTFKVH